MNNFIEIKSVTKTFDNGAIKALDKTDLVVKKGEFLSIMGPSGCGKSTLLNMIGALDSPTAGDVIVDGKNLAEYNDLSVYRATKVGFIFQLHNLIPTLTAIENVQVPMIGVLAKEKRISKAKELLSLVGLKGHDYSLPTKLSGGERQKIAVARALANDPEILIADEPTGSLDSISSKNILDLMENIHHQIGMTVILVTHDHAVAARADIKIKMIDGKIK